MAQSLTTEFIGRMEEAVRAGEFPSEAAKRLGGVSTRRWNIWWRKGVEFYDDPDKSQLEAEDRLAVELVGRVWVAEAGHENEMRELWQQSLKDGKAGLWQGYKNLVELRYSDRWRKREMEKGPQKQVAPEEEFRMMAEEKRKASVGD